MRSHEEDSNFIPLCKLRAHDSNKMSRWLDKKGDKYLSPDIQNELIQLISSSMLESIASDIQSAKYFSIMADEWVGVSNHEQLTICLRWVDDSLEVHEDFMCLYNIPNTTADTITAGIKDVLSEMKLQIQRCRDSAMTVLLAWLVLDGELLIKF